MATMRTINISSRPEKLGLTIDIDIQSELHQTKRRFTDFLFQRVPAGGNGNNNDSRPSGDSTSSSPAITAARRPLRTPRSVSSLNLPKGSAARNAAAATATAAAPPPATSGVPMVRATSPGAEIREEKRLAAARKEKDEKLKRALHSSPAPESVASESPAPSGSGSGRGSSPVSVASSGGKTAATSSLRRFQISRSRNLHKSVDGGIQKRRGPGGAGASDGVAVLVEKLKRKPHSRQASMVADRLALQADEQAREEPPARPRKRPVVNQAEKKWREERKNSISAAKQHISQVMDKGAQAQHQSSWEDESERLAHEFEQIALELDSDKMETAPTPAAAPGPAPRPTSLSKPPLKYQPRTPNKPRLEKPAQPQPHPPTEHEGGEDDDDDGDYVYDVYIRRPLPEKALSNPLVDLETDQDGFFRHNGIDSTRQDIGVIVITQEDEGYWENFVEDDDDEEHWDSEDADSNGTLPLPSPACINMYTKLT